MIEILDDRDLALKTGVLALRDRILVTQEQLEKVFSDYSVKVLSDEGVPLGMLTIKGPEIHIAIIPSYRKRWASKRLLDEMLSEPLQNGYAVTSVMKDNKIGRDFVTRIGFKRTHETATVIHYRMEK